MGKIAEYDDIYQGSDYLRAVNKGKITSNDMVLLLSMGRGAATYRALKTTIFIHIGIF